MKFALSYFTAVGSFALAVTALGCTVTATDTADGGDTGTVTGDTGIKPPTDTGTPSETSPPADTGTTWVAPPDPTAFYTRFVVATSDFTDGTDFDVCYLPWDGTTPASDADVYTGPLAAAFGSSFSAPEVTNYYKLSLDSSHQHIRIRLVAKGGDCTKASKFHINKDGADRIVSIDDPTATFQQGYNTAIVFGNVSAATSYHLLSVADPDPTAAASVPTLQFFNGYSGSLGISLKGTDGTTYTLSTGPIPFKAYVSLPFTTTAPSSGVINIASVTFTDPSGGSPVTISLSDFAFSTGYYWAFAYGNSIDALKLYLCSDSLAQASSGNVAVSGCKILP